MALIARLFYGSHAHTDTHIGQYLYITTNIERVQRRATNYSRSTDYKTRLIKLHLLPLTLWFELQDLMFLVKCLKFPSDNVDLSGHLKLISSITRAGSAGTKFQHHLNRTSTARQSYYNRIVRLWNKLGPIDLTLSIQTIRKHISDFLWEHFLRTLDCRVKCSFHLVCPCSKCF